MSKKTYFTLIGIIIFTIIMLLGFVLSTVFTAEKIDNKEFIEAEALTIVTTDSEAEVLDQKIVQYTEIAYTITTTETTTTVVMTTTSTDSTTVETTTSTTEAVVEDCYYFYQDSMRVHTADCQYADPSCMEAIYGDYIDTARKCQVCNPDITIGEEYIPPKQEAVQQVASSSDNNSSGSRNYTVSEMTYYSGGYGCYGASGRTLINNYSVACNSIPLGTIVYIKSSDGSIDGTYRVDDTGAMGGHVIDIFYSNYSNVPSSFRNLGRVSCEVWIVG